MPKTIDHYQLLLSRGGRGSLWLGEDHLLMIEASSLLLCYKETYRRLDYANIQAILQGKSRRGMWQTILLVLFLVFFSWLMIIVGSDEWVAGTAQIRDLATGESREVDREDLVAACRDVSVFQD